MTVFRTYFLHLPLSYTCFKKDRSNYFPKYQGAYKSLARPTCRCILFDGENISFDASLVLYIYIYIYIYIYSTIILPIMITNRIYENQYLLSLYPVPVLVGLRTYQHPCIVYQPIIFRVT